MRHAKLVTVTAAVFGFLACVAGCKREQAGAPPVQPTAPEQTKFFARLAAEPGAGTLKGRLKAKFPDLDLHVGGGGGNVASAPGQPLKPTVLVQVVVNNGTKFEEARAGLLGELEEYLKTLAGSTGAEVIGPVREELKDGKKVGFRFEYKAPENSGNVTVGPQPDMLYSIQVVAEESR